MVNPYQPSESLPQDEDAADLSVVGERFQAVPWFAGGWKSIAGIGAATGFLLLFMAWIGNSSFSILTLCSLGILFAMNFAILKCLRGIQLHLGTQIGCAALLTPVSMILFVPVCFGGVVTLSIFQPLWPPFSAVVFPIGFIIIAAGIAIMVRTWATSRAKHLAMPPSDFPPEPIVQEIPESDSL